MENKPRSLFLSCRGSPWIPGNRPILMTKISNRTTKSSALANGCLGVVESFWEFGGSWIVLDPLGDCGVANSFKLGLETPSLVDEIKDSVDGVIALSGSCWWSVILREREDCERCEILSLSLPFERLDGDSGLEDFLLRIGVRVFSWGPESSKLSKPLPVTATKSIDGAC